MRFIGSGGPHAKLVFNRAASFYGLYAPTGQGPGKGCVDLVCCRNVRMTGCKISALGDTMHIQRSHNVIVNGNQIIGSRMGAFFLAEYCKNSTISGNTVCGTNGSRVMSIEKSNEDVTVTGNTFRGGGRGSWINQPKNLIMQGNVFVNNTTKCEANPRRGRRCPVTGGWEKFAEIYFTTYEPNATYGPVILNDNIIHAGPEAHAAVQFMAGARDIVMKGNILNGAVKTILPPPDGIGATIMNNFVANAHSGNAVEDGVS